MRIKTFICLILIAVGLSICLVQLFQGNWLSAISGLLLGVLSSIGLLFGSEFKYMAIGVAVSLVIGVMSIFFESRAFNFELQNAHSDVLAAFMGMELLCRPMSLDLSEIKARGINFCTVANTHDQMNASFELQKSLILTPTVSLIDSFGSTVKGTVPDRCAEAVQSAIKICPTAFVGIKESRIKLLLDQK